MGARPLRITTFNDKIVQEAIKIILEAIYEPEFNRLNTKYGFRQGKGVHDVMINIASKAKGYDNSY